MNREILTLERLKGILKDRGFTVVIDGDGRPVLRGKVEQATPALMRVVAMYRDELIAELKKGKS